jgi:hypothetical protein
MFTDRFGTGRVDGSTLSKIRLMGNQCSGSVDRAGNKCTLRTGTSGHELSGSSAIFLGNLNCQ